ncbi:hypothetical protein DFQ28_008276 [Apophysomyces sp. BC1034]|nr:hypothetical protein DFQ30_008044 [Apophysomyces sp. BC1015]KAG0170602.1 hypothetical protein DFQ29_009206 [Apophysomyces sp. BC1021]KAG0186123.1 hypothetical protein DFQ28_008276 [Apophysomyces sp. BC1034]
MVEMMKCVSTTSNTIRRTSMWESNKLALRTSNEDWYRINVLSMLWDRALLYETEFDVIRDYLYDVQKCEKMGEQTLMHWLKHCGEARCLVEEFMEAVSIQWHGTRGIVYGSKLLFVQKKKGSVPVYSVSKK